MLYTSFWSYVYLQVDFASTRLVLDSDMELALSRPIHHSSLQYERFCTHRLVVLEDMSIFSRRLDIYTYSWLAEGFNYPLSAILRYCIFIPSQSFQLNLWNCLAGWFKLLLLPVGFPYGVYRTIRSLVYSIDNILIKLRFKAWQECINVFLIWPFRTCFYFIFDDYHSYPSSFIPYCTSQLPLPYNLFDRDRRLPHSCCLIHPSATGHKIPRNYTKSVDSSRKMCSRLPCSNWKSPSKKYLL